MTGAAMNRPQTADLACCDYCGLQVMAPAPPGEANYCCFGCQFADQISRQPELSETGNTPATALGLSAFCTMNVVMMTMALWSYAAELQTPFEAALRNFLRYGAMAFSAPVFLLLGRPLFSHAIMALKRNSMTTDLLLSTGVIAAFVFSIVNTIRDSGHVYFEVGCVILVLVTLGRWLEAVGRSNASTALAQLEKLVPETVRKWQGSEFVEIPRLQATIGDHLRILSGERIPLDGRVVRGRGIVDEQFFTGESTPVEKQPGDPLLGGSLNLDGDVVFEATSPPEGGALGRLVNAVQIARLEKGRYQRLSDTWSKWFFSIISLIAVLAMIFHGLRSGWEAGLMTSLAVLLIACPCALALATPLAVWTALAVAARRGVLFRSGEAIESLATIRAIRWDKTGTLTTGSPRVIQLHCETAASRATIEQLADCITGASNHVFSKAIHDFLPNSDSGDHIGEITSVPGRGLQTFNRTGQCIRVGSVPWMNEQRVRWGDQLTAVMQSPEINRACLIAVSIDEQVEGLFRLDETIRPEAWTAINACRALGFDQAILTGDRWDRANVLSEMLAIPVQAQLLPEDKLAAIASVRDQWKSVAMVGDGLNDAPALAAADVGIALGCGADVSRDSAAVCLLTSNLTLVAWACEYSRQTVRTIRGNLVWSFGYNSLGVLVAACGHLHPAAAAALMVISSLMVLGNSLRLSNSLKADCLTQRADAFPARLQSESTESHLLTEAAT